MIRIAFLIDMIHSPHAGTEKQLLGIIERLNLNHFEPHLLCLRNSDWLRDAKLPCPVTVLDFYSIFGRDYRRCGKEFRDYCRSNRIDLIQTFFHDSNIVGTLWGRSLAGTKIIASRRSLGTGYWHNWKEIRILRYLRKYTQHYIANSRACEDEATRVERLDPSRVTVIPNGLDVDSFQDPGPELRRTTRTRWGFTDDSIVIGTVANLRPIKNLPFLIEAAAIVTERHPQARFVVLGEGDRRQELESLIAARNLVGKVVLPGRSENVSEELFAFDIAVLCSQSESLSNALMEFMAAARPCVASDVGGNAELICSTDLGVIYPPDDQKRFVGALVDLIENVERRQEVGDSARKHAEETFSWESVLKQLETTYRQISEFSDPA
jgi:glycosyltransferase involved in cell wall biosynthesis